jgi:plasmid stabilization system protein ParE
VISYTPRAARQVRALLDHYHRLERPEAIANLLAALREASATVENNPAAGLAAPRSYPNLIRPGWAWVKAGRYWFAYRQRPTVAFVAVFYETANIPARLST